MDPLLFRQFEFVDLVTHQVQNSKKPKKLHLQLLITFGFDIFAIQSNFLTRSETSRLSSFIVSLFLQFLDILQVFFTCSHEILKFFGQLISCFGPTAGVDQLFIGNAWVIPTLEIKKRVLHASIFRVIISEFCHRQKPRLVVLFIINKGSKVSFYYAVLPLSLAVGLKVEDGRKSQFDAQKVAQGGPELGREY